MKFRFGILTSLAVIVFGLFANLAFPDAAYADGVGGPYISKDMTSLSKKYAAQEAFLSCFARGTVRYDVPKVSSTVQVDRFGNPIDVGPRNEESKKLALTRDKALQGKIFNNPKGSNGEVVVGYVGFGGREDGRVNCSDGDFTMEGQSLNILQELGWNDGLVALCEMGAKPVDENNQEISGKNCTDSDVQYLKPPTYDGVLAAITKKNPGIAANLPGGVKAGGRYYLTKPGHYVTDWYALKSRCNIRDAVEVKSASESGVKKDGSGNIPTGDRVLIHTVNKDGTISYISYTRDANINNMNVYAIMDRESDGWGWVPKDCNDLARDLNTNAAAYASYLRDYQRAAGGLAGMEGEAGGTVSENNNTGGDESCAGGALGWVFCPLVNLVSSGIQSGAGAMDGFMRFQPLMGTDQGDAVFSVWRIVVGLANLALVAAFLVVIFSQATSVGLSAYGIKKMLPRIIAAAILINISFYICAILVDIFNIIGASIAGIVQGAIQVLPPPKVASNAPAGFGPYVASLSVLALGATALAFTTSLAFLLPLSLTILSSVIVILLILALRHTLALLLIMISPLAFAAMILPNTDSMFKKWWKALWITLALYPVIMALAYGSMLVSKILLTATPTTGPNHDPDGLVGILHVIIAVTIPVVWVFALKFIVTWGAGLVGKIGGMINDRNKGLIDRSRKWADQKRQNTTVGQIMDRRRNAVNTNAQQRGYRRMGKGIVGGAAKFGMMGNSRQLMDVQIDEANSKIHAQQVDFAKQAVSKRYNASNPDHRRSMAQEAVVAARAGDQIKLDALMSHAATVGADEFADVYNRIQESVGDDELAKKGGKTATTLGLSNRFISATHGGELGQKNRGLSTMLQTGNPTTKLEDIMHDDDGIRTYYQRMSAEKAAVFSSDTARAAAQFLDDDVLMKLVYDPNTSKSVGTSAMAAYRDELASRMGYGGDGSTVTQGHPGDPSRGIASSPSRRARDPNILGRGASLPENLADLRAGTTPPPADGSGFSI